MLRNNEDDEQRNKFENDCCNSAPRRVFTVMNRF
jgi:hypothetical protein